MAHSVLCLCAFVKAVRWKKYKVAEQKRRAFSWTMFFFVFDQNY